MNVIRLVNKRTIFLSSLGVSLFKLPDYPINNAKFEMPNIKGHKTKMRAKKLEKKEFFLHFFCYEFKSERETERNNINNEHH